MKRIRIGISTCPNDTFFFHALLAGECAIEGVELEFTLADVEELNRGMFEGRFDVCKVSAHAALLAEERVQPLSVGWALGYGVGPVVLGAPRDERKPAKGSTASDVLLPETRVLAPGEWTTATLLWRMFHPEPVQLEQRVFSEIMPALQAREADLGVCIHEGRFTYLERGLVLAEDLGDTWEREVGGPLPLGGLVADRGLAADLIQHLTAGFRASLDWGLQHRQACLASMRAHAQEASEEVLFGHVELYVSRWTRELGAEGERALATLARLYTDRIGREAPE